MNEQPNGLPLEGTQGALAKVPGSRQQKFLRPPKWPKPPRDRLAAKEKPKQVAQEPPKPSEEEQTRERMDRSVEMIREGIEEYYRDAGLPVPDFNEYFENR